MTPPEGARLTAIGVRVHLANHTPGKSKLSTTHMAAYLLTRRPIFETFEVHSNIMGGGGGGADRGSESLLSLFDATRRHTLIRSLAIVLKSPNWLKEFM